jgi:nickel-dependent lactate racemase
MQEDRMVTRGIFAGDDETAYREGAELCRRVSIINLDRPARKIVAFMDGEEIFFVPRPASGLWTVNCVQ